ncbi:DNA-processing protein DprA [Denitromonas halophila]|uniref:DNA-protecting protein DprA n=1 Tax=Denitromonas halophila TaxID=1629404 RepID=A0A557R1H0_9RHOO|nr:DNA-processing protein DprA [Denitromonas halophila]TVO58990.1 DNA-protecting protein DprA [Denitromonas halophila]
MSPSELADWLRLTLIPGLGGGRQRRLLKAFGLPAAVFAAHQSAIAELIGDKLARALHDHDASDAIAATQVWADQPGNTLLTLADAGYPQRLLELPDPPTLLYVKGDVSLLNRPGLAIVGARSATPQGESNAAAFAGALARAGLAIISGLALGIDAAAHAGALDADGATIAVIGTGADRMYPARNQALARRILERGAIVTEFPLGTQVAAHNFPRRNRIISGLAQGVLVVEAALNSGSLITARLASEQGREVFAIPGSIHSPQSKGCHRLIRDGAKLVETAEDILEESVFSGYASAPPMPLDTPAEPVAETDETTDHLLAALGHDPVSLDTLAARTGLTADALYAILLSLELDGHLARLPGGRFQRLT